MPKIVARAKDWMRKWEINGKSRRHIAWPHDIVCSRWLARAASEIVTYAKQVTIFNQMVVVSNDQTQCLEVGVLTAHLVSNCRSVVFLANGFLCLSHPGTLWGTEKSVEQNFAQAAAHLPFLIKIGLGFVFYS